MFTVINTILFHVLHLQSALSSHLFLNAVCAWVCMCVHVCWCFHQTIEILCISEKCLSYPTIPFITIVTHTEAWPHIPSRWSSMPFTAVWNFALHPGSNQAVQIAFGGHVPLASFSQEQSPWVSLLFMNCQFFKAHINYHSGCLDVWIHLFPFPLTGIVRSWS